MKILFWLNYYLPELGGIQTFSRDLVPVLGALGHDVLLLAGHGPTPAPDDEILCGVHVRRVDFMAPIIQRRPGDMLRAKRRIQEIIEWFEPEVIHLHPTGPECIYYLQLQRNRPIPTALTLHNNFSQAAVDIGRTPTFMGAFAHASAIAAVSDDSRRWLLGEVPELAERTTTIVNGIKDLDRISAPLSWNPPAIGYIGRFDVQKRPDVLLDAFDIAAASHPTVQLMLAGSGSLGTWTQSRIDQSPYRERIMFLGRLDPSEVPDLLDRLTMFCMSSDYEGLPIAALEAARNGRPIVATDVGGMREVIKNGETGLLTPAGSASELAESLLTLLRDPRRTAIMGERAAGQFGQHFSLQTCAARYVELYERTLAHGPQFVS